MKEMRLRRIGMNKKRSKKEEMERSKREAKTKSRANTKNEKE
jgi:hypothetical protein